jgi:hypothetical protein
VDGETEICSAAKEASLEGSLDLALSQNYPNPFNPTTMISFTLPQRTRVTLSIYDVKGRAVRVLVDDIISAGFKEYEWDGKDSRGHPVTSGLYFYCLDAGDRSVTKKMAVLR